MITEKQKCIAEQAIYSDLEGIDFGDTYTKPQKIAGFQGRLVYLGCTLNGVDKIKPILRPLSDLTKQITHKGYNDNKLFVPIIELEPHFDKEMYEDDLSNGIEPHLALEYATYTGHHFKVTDLLHQLHFDTRELISTNEAIDANSLLINPYTIQQ